MLCFCFVLFANKQRTAFAASLVISIWQYEKQTNRLIFFSSDTIDSKLLLNNRKSSTRQRPRPSKRKLSTIPTTNLLQTLPTSIPTRSENLLDYNIARHLRLDQPCNLLTSIKDNFSSTAALTPITDIRYEIVDLFTKGTNSHMQQQHHQQNSPLPSIASLMNRHSSPIVSPTKQTIGINTDPLTTSTTNILHQPVATSWWYWFSFSFLFSCFLFSPWLVF